MHANNHFRALEGVKGTAENLEAAAGGENYEVVSMYPPMLSEAEAEGDKRAALSFKYALAVEKVHEGLYRQAAESLAQGKDLPETEYYVCPVCGNTHAGPLTGRCPVCSTPGEKYEKVA